MKATRRRGGGMSVLLERLELFFQLHAGVSIYGLRLLSRCASLSTPVSIAQHEAHPPLVSVIVTCYNYACYLADAVGSVLAQGYRNFEIIIVNDGSTDATRQVAEALIAAHPQRLIRLINQENSGQPAIARNNGIACSRGSYVLCLDADDMIAPSFLEECVGLLERDPSVSIAYTDQRYFDDAGSRDVRLCRYSLRRLLQANFISCCSLFRREAWIDAGGYRTNVRGYEDWDFWIACGERGYFGRRIPRPLFLYRQHSSGLYASALRDDEKLRAQVVMNHPALYGRRKKRWAREVLHVNHSPDNKSFRIVALVCAHNEGDIIGSVIGDLVSQGVYVYLINHCSTDNTAAEAGHWLGRGLLHIENFPEDAGYPEENRKQYLWSHILRRKEELAATIDADWFIHHDADEFRESPWQGVTLDEAIRMVDRLGFNAIGFSLLDFHPVDNSFLPGSDVRDSLRYYQPGESFNQLQVKAWKRQPKAVNLVGSGGHCVDFPGKSTFPIRFLLRHYPVRSQRHGMEKVFKQRKERFCARERGTGWHQQYDHIAGDGFSFLHDPRELTLYEGAEVRRRLFLEDAAAVASRLLRDGTVHPWLTVELAEEPLVERCADIIGTPPPDPHAVSMPDAHVREYVGLLALLAQLRDTDAAKMHADPKNRLSCLGRGVKLWHFCRIRADLAARRFLSRLRGL